MTRLVNDPQAFVGEMIEGFVAAHPGYVRAVDGGVVRVDELTRGKVAVVVGGGSGHYPAFAGLVGPGLAAGAAMGNVFASPAAAHVESIARTAERGGGVLLTYGNYAGDVLNFDEAQDSLRAAGIPCETVVVTDDVSTAPPDRRHLRRGIAGDLVVFKCAGAAAEAGYQLADVVRVARAANERTRSIGAAFTGCTLPGASAPLFTVPDGRMALGMGIHGEPGIAETDVPSADELAAMLVEALLADLPSGVVPAAGVPVVPILNGLGTVKYEELFVVYRRVARLLADVDVDVVDPQVGEFCTSFDMAGVSLTLFWPDDELAELWGAPADTPAFRRSPAAITRTVADAGMSTSDADSVSRTEPGSAASRRLADRLIVAFDAAARAIDLAADDLGRLDAVAGDGDHGIGMQRGVHAALAAARQVAAGGAGAGTLLRAAGAAWAREAGGTSGALWGSALRAIGDAVGDQHVPDAPTLGAAVTAGCARVQERGGAVVGDKTMVDALVPFAHVLDAELASGATPLAALGRAAAAARDAAAATAELLPRLGRARPHAERSVGTPDPGAQSLALVVNAVARAFADASESGVDAPSFRPTTIGDRS